MRLKRATMIHPWWLDFAREVRLLHLRDPLICHKPTTGRGLIREAITPGYSPPEGSLCRASPLFLTTVRRGGWLPRIQFYRTAEGAVQAYNPCCALFAVRELCFESNRSSAGSPTTACVRGPVPCSRRDS